MTGESEELALYSTRGLSMLPFIRPSDQVVVKKVSFGEIQPGDTIVFKSDSDDRVCHKVERVKKVDDILWFYTRPYTSKSCDKPTRQERVLGKVIAIRRRSDLIILSNRGWRSMLYKLNCLFREMLFYLKRALAKIPFLVKAYRRIRLR